MGLYPLCKLDAFCTDTADLTCSGVYVCGSRGGSETRGHLECTPASRMYTLRGKWGIFLSPFREVFSSPVVDLTTPRKGKQILFVNNFILCFCITTNIYDTLKSYLKKIFAVSRELFRAHSPQLKFLTQSYRGRREFLRLQNYRRSYPLRVVSRCTRSANNTAAPINVQRV